MAERQKLQEEIKMARYNLDAAIENDSDFDSYYELSLKLDMLIEEYIDLCEEEKAMQNI